MNENHPYWRKKARNCMLFFKFPNRSGKHKLERANSTNGDLAALTIKLTLYTSYLPVLMFKNALGSSFPSHPPKLGILSIRCRVQTIDACLLLQPCMSSFLQHILITKIKAPE